MNTKKRRLVCLHLWLSACPHLIPSDNAVFVISHEKGNCTLYTFLGFISMWFSCGFHLGMRIETIASNVWASI